MSHISASPTEWLKTLPAADDSAYFLISNLRQFDDLATSPADPHAGAGTASPATYPTVEDAPADDETMLALWEQKTGNARVWLTCEYCGKRFRTRNPERRTCSKTCKTYLSREKNSDLK